MRGPLSLQLDAQGQRAAAPPADARSQPAGLNIDGDGRISLTIGGSSIRLAGQVEAARRSARSVSRSPAVEKGSGSPGINAYVKIEKARIAPELMRVLAPGAGSKLKAALTISGDATLDGATGKLATNVEMAAGGGAVTIRGSVDLERQSLDGLSVRAKDIDLGRLITEGSPSEISFALDAHAEGHSLATLRGAATFKMPAGRLGGYAIGPIRLRADADRGHYKVMDLLAVIPGVNITGAGEATAQRVAFRGAVDLRDLGTTVRSLTAGSRSGTPRASGRGRVDVTLNGDVRGPALTVKGHLVALGWQDIRIPVLDVDAEIPDVRVPQAASVNLKVPQADVGIRHFRGLSVNLRAGGPRFDARLALSAPEALRLDVSGVWGAGHEEIGVQSLALQSRRATWKSARPMRLVFSDKALRVIDLDWRTADGQRIAVDLEKRASTVRGDVVVSGLDLARLPESLLPPSVVLAGRLEAEVHLRGRMDHPDVEAKVTLARGRVGNVREITLATELRLSGRRVSGKLDAAALGARATGDFDLPASWPPPRGAGTGTGGGSSSKLTANLAATNVDLQRVIAVVASARDARDQVVASGAVTRVVAKPPLDVRGNASWRVKLSGTGASPQLTMQADVQRLKVAGTTVGDLHLEVDAQGERPVTARVELRQVRSVLPASPGNPVAGAAQSVVAVRTGFSLGKLIHHPPATAKALLSKPLHVDARVNAVNVAPLAALGGYPSKVGGTVSLAANLDGTLQSVQGKVALTLAGISTGRFPPTDGVLNLELGQRDVRADARITRRGATLFVMSTRVGAAAARFAEPKLAELLADVPVELHAMLGPLDLQRVGLPPQTDRQPARILKGRLRAQADVTGTMRAPRVNLRADATDLRLDQTPIGTAALLLTYADRKATGDATLISANQGRLHLVASTSADLGYPAIRRGLDPERLPVTARLDAKGFDVGGLSGATPGLRTVAGQLFAAVEVTGTAADPRPSGQLEWKDGGLTITGMGEYKHIHFLARGDKEHIFLDELRAESGGGRARVTARGDHRPGNGYGIKATMELRDFPAYVEGQALAALSLEAKADTEVSVRRVRADVSIGSARLALSDAKRKHLQKLAAPADVVLTDGGQPINTAQARKLAAVNAVLARPDDQNKEQARAQAAATAAPGSGNKPAGVIIIVDAPRNLWVSGKDANVELGLLPGFRVEIADATRIFGQVVIRRGRVDVVGRRFDLKADSTARFTGPVGVPELDVSAKHVNEQEKITVLVTVTGSPGHLHISITAPDRPDLTETQLYTLIVTGR
ncbi:MAG: translocation/assembly module TamB domain-containing protein, partial [Polyangia bacterium]